MLVQIAQQEEQVPLKAGRGRAFTSSRARAAHSSGPPQRRSTAWHTCTWTHNVLSLMNLFTFSVFCLSGIQRIPLLAVKGTALPVDISSLALSCGKEKHGCRGVPLDY